MQAISATGPAARRAVIESIRRRLDDARVSHTYRDYSNALKLISQVVFTRTSAFVLEFLQNAEDAGLGRLLKIPVGSDWQAYLGLQDRDPAIAETNLVAGGDDGAVELA